MFYNCIWVSLPSCQMMRRPTLWRVYLCLFYHKVVCSILYLGELAVLPAEDDEPANLLKGSHIYFTNLIHPPVGGGGMKGGREVAKGGQERGERSGVLLLTRRIFKTNRTGWKQTWFTLGSLYYTLSPKKYESSHWNLVGHGWSGCHGIRLLPHSWAQQKLSPLSLLNPLNILLSINGPLLSLGFNGLND